MALLRSWVESANNKETEFPLNNLPYGVFSSGDRIRHCGVAIGDKILDVTALESVQVLSLRNTRLFAGGSWNAVMEAGSELWADLREQLTSLLKESSDKRGALAAHLVDQAGATMHMPFNVTEFTDFFSGRNHAENAGAMFHGGEKTLPPNWLSIPIAYNGRASSIVVSGTDVRRPWGQVKRPDEELPIFTPSRRFDIELEMGAIVGRPSHGPVTVAEADAMIFGFVLLNDWSARDIQAWEYQPLGPFQSKATATSISPWIVTKAALEPFRTSTPEPTRELLPYLSAPGPMLYDIALAIDLAPEGEQATTIANTNFGEMYYSPAQQLAHHSLAGCPMRVGDVLGSGTISGPTNDSLGCLLELSWGGQRDVQVGSTTRTFLEDGDTITFQGAAHGDGYRVGFGDCVGKVLPALEDPYARKMES